MSRKSELVDISVLIRMETDKAVLVSEGLTGPNGKEIRHWLPRSQIEIEPDMITYDGQTEPVVVTMPRWLCEEKGFIVD